MRNRDYQPQGASGDWGRVGLLLAVAFFLGVGDAAAQAAAEYAGAVSAARGVAASANAATTISFPSFSQQKGKPQKGKFLHLPPRTVEVDEAANRRALEEGAGEDAGVILLRSEPTKAIVWVDGKRVGSTPLLLLLAPGSYRVEMRSQRMESSRRQVEVAPKEKQEVLLPLASRYPAEILVRLR